MFLSGPSQSCLVVSVFTFNSDDPSLSPAEVDLHFSFCKRLLEKNERKQKIGWDFIIIKQEFCRTDAYLSRIKFHFF